MPDLTRKTGVFMGTDATSRDLDMAAVAVGAAIGSLATEPPDTSVDYEMPTVSVQWVESPSVRLARWLDADPEREREIVSLQDLGSEGWRCVLWCETTKRLTKAYRPTRDEAITAALDLAESAPVEGGAQ